MIIGYRNHEKRRALIKTRRLMNNLRYTPVGNLFQHMKLLVARSGIQLHFARSVYDTAQRRL